MHAWIFQDVHEQLRTTVISCNWFTGRHTADIAAAYTATAMAYGLDKKLVGMITDNASNMAKAFKSMTIKPRLHDKTCCQTGCLYTRYIRLSKHDTTGCQTGLTTGCIMYTNIQPFDNRLYHVNNRLDVCLHDTASCQTRCTTVWQLVVSCKRGISTDDNVHDDRLEHVDADWDKLQNQTPIPIPFRHSCVVILYS